MIIAGILCAKSKTPENTIYVAVSFGCIMAVGDHMTGFLHNMGNLEKNMISVKRCLNLLEIP